MSLLSVQNLGKAYRTYRSEWQRFASWFGLPVKPSEEHWVLRHVNFDIQPGEAIGIVGQNGAGKSTLLKMITGTLQPTEGQVQVGGRIGAILELGMGFNPELTGRQNAYHGLGLMGFSHVEIENVMPELEAFAEIGEYFNEPVRVYSSGMQMRVAFAVVTAFRPDILIVDEALSVGDSYFQFKCINKVRKYLDEGTTLLFVSHDPGAIKTLCKRAIFIDGGQIVTDDSASKVLDLYQSLMLKKEHENNESIALKESKIKLSVVKENIISQTANSSTLIAEDVIDSVSMILMDENGRPVSHLVSGNKLTVDISVKFKMDIEDPHVGFGIRDKNGLIIYDTNTYCMHKKIGFIKKDENLLVSFVFDCHLGEGNFAFVLGVANTGFGRSSFKETLYFDQAFKVLRVILTDDDIWSGFFNLRPEVIIERKI